MPQNPQNRRAFNVAAGQAWAIQEDALENILTIAAREHEIDGQDVRQRLEAVEKKIGRPLNNTQRVTTRDGIATLEISGPIFRYANWMTEISGATSIDVLARDFDSAINDASVKAIILAVDSPGGTVSGVSEFAQHVFEARGQKPIIADITDLGASAAYWIASAADEIVVSDTARVGSIGVVSTYDKRPNEREGKIISSQSPYKQADPNTQDGLVKAQAMIDSLADVFIDTVARNRGVSREKVMSDFGQGGLFVGGQAVDAGLADRVGTYESLLAELTSADGMKRFRKEKSSPVRMIVNKGEIDMKDNQTTTQEPAATETPVVTATVPAVPAITADSIKADHPAVAAALQAEGAVAERARIQAVQAKGALIPGHEKLIAEMMFDGKTTGAEASDRILQAEGRVRTDAMAGIKADAPKPLEQPPMEAQTLPAAAPAGEYDETAVKTQWENDSKIRAEFRTLENYAAFRKAEASGQARIFNRA